MLSRSDLSHHYDLICTVVGLTNAPNGMRVRTSVELCHNRSMPDTVFLYWTEELVMPFPVELLEVAVRGERGSYEGHGAGPVPSHEPSIILNFSSEMEVAPLQLPTREVLRFLGYIGRGRTRR